MKKGQEVGEISDKGYGITGGTTLPRNRRLHPDDARLDAFWTKCAELKMPVNIHMADHPSCWTPLDIYQEERTPDYQHFNQYGKDVPSFDELIAMRNRTLEKHPKTIFIACHMGNQGHNLAALSQAMDKYPNLYLDTSARDYEIGRTPGSSAKFLAKYRKRIVFGTDMGRRKVCTRATGDCLKPTTNIFPVESDGDITDLNWLHLFLNQFIGVLVLSLLIIELQILSEIIKFQKKLNSIAALKCF